MIISFRNHFLCIAEINCNKFFILHINKSAIMSQMTLNITLHGSNCNTLLRHFIP